MANADLLGSMDQTELDVAPGPFTSAFFGLDDSLLPAYHGASHEHFLSRGRDDLQRLGLAVGGCLSSILDAVGVMPLRATLSVSNTL